MTILCYVNVLRESLNLVLSAMHPLTRFNHRKISNGLINRFLYLKANQRAYTRVIVYNNTL